jgi:predicted RNA polymerase sigma factor
LHAPLGELYLQLNEKAKAKLYFENALHLTHSNAEKKLLVEKSKAVDYKTC